jgi:hypothetical protein
LILQPGNAKRSSADLYIDIVAKSVLDLVYDDRERDLSGKPRGGNWPVRAHTMIGATRMQNVIACVREVIDRGVPGDLIETGVWRGGATIVMRAILQAFGITDRSVWVADSFAGIPPPDVERFPDDEGMNFSAFTDLIVPLEEVKRNFASYGLLDDQVKFAKGWFRDTLPSLDVRQLAVMRLDGDLYESTIIALQSLYPKLSVGGYCIVDDYGAVPACAKAVEDYRSHNGITETLQTVDWTCVFWKRDK